MDRRARIFVIEGLALLRACLCAVLRQCAEFEVVGEWESCSVAGPGLVQLSPDVILIGTTRGDVGPLDFVRSMQKTQRPIRTLRVLLSGADDLTQACLNAGMNGYVLMTATDSELYAAVRSTTKGHAHTSDNAVIEETGPDNKPVHPPGSKRGPGVLTPREQTVLTMVARAFTNKRIAAALNLSVHTVEKHRSNLMGKLQLRNAAELTAYAIYKGWGSLDADRV